MICLPYKNRQQKSEFFLNNARGERSFLSIGDAKLYTTTLYYTKQLCTTLNNSEQQKDNTEQQKNNSEQQRNNSKQQKNNTGQQKNNSEQQKNNSEQ